MTLNGGFTMNAWYDIYSLEKLEAKEDKVNLKASAEYAVAASPIQHISRILLSSNLSPVTVACAQVH